MAISGIEDEYELPSGLPCLVYVKEPAPGREPRLEELLERVQAEDRVDAACRAGARAGRSLCTD